MAPRRKSTVQPVVKAYCIDPDVVKDVGYSILYNNQAFKSEEGLYDYLSKTFTPAVSTIIVTNLKKDHAVDGTVFKMLVDNISKTKSAIAKRARTSKPSTSKGDKDTSSTQPSVSSTKKTSTTSVDSTGSVEGSKQPKRRSTVRKTSTSSSTDESSSK